MKCPNSGHVNQDGKRYPDEFNQWNNFCQGCDNYDHCIDRKVEKDFSTNPEPNGNTIDKSPSGDNFPTFGTIHQKLSLNRSRTEMVKKLLKEDTPKITKDDIIDIGIDIELYNKQCRQEKIKRQYKQRTSKDDNI